LSWDEDEDGGVGGTSNSALSDRDSMHSSTLPDLVSFNMKDGALNSLQQLQGASGSELPLPTPINFGEQKIKNGPQSADPQGEQQQEEQKVNRTQRNEGCSKFSII
jgi:hypothetical protein